MYQVGTNIGNPHQEQQGTGYATVLPQETLLTQVAKADLATKRAEQAKKREDLLAAHKQFSSMDPDNWYVHDKEINSMLTGFIDKGSNIVKKGVNPWTSVDQESVDLQKESKRLNAYVNASKQLREDFTKLQSAYNTPAERSKIENWDEIVEFYANPSITDIVDNGRRPPQVKFKAPTIDSYKVMADLTNTWATVNKKDVMSRQEALELAKVTVANPAMNDGVGGGFMGMKQQEFAQLPPETQEAFKNRGARNGASAFEEYFADQIFSFKGSGVNLTETFIDFAKKKPISDTKIEDESGLTISSSRFKGSDDQIKKEMKDILRINMGQVEREVESGLYGSIDNNIEQNLDAAVEKYFPTVKANMRRDYGESRDSTSAGKKESEQSAVNWYNDITSGNPSLVKNAIQYLDKKNVEGMIPSLNKSADVQERVDKFYVDADGIPRADIVDKDGEATRTVEIPILMIGEESLKNVYRDQYEGTRRNYETTETGSKPQSTNPGKSAEQKSQPKPPSLKRAKVPGFNG